MHPSGLNTPNAPSSSLDVIIRIHDIARGHELRHCLFSLVCQSYRPITLHIVAQRFSEVDSSAPQRAIDPVMALDETVSYHIWNYSKPEPADARSALLNLGISKGKGRYLAVLDHDDTIHPEAYTLLIKELALSSTAIAFAGIAVKDVELFQDAVLTINRRRLFLGSNILDLFADNFCPIHSFVLDRSILRAEDLWFDEGMCKLEDYDFLIRITAKYLSSFRLMDRCVGDYYFKNDGSNTICVPSTDSPERVAAWNQARWMIAERRTSTVLSDVVQSMLGMSPADPQLTVQKAVELFR